MAHEAPAGGAPAARDMPAWTGWLVRVLPSLSPSVGCALMLAFGAFQGTVSWLLAAVLGVLALAVPASFLALRGAISDTPARTQTLVAAECLLLLCVLMAAYTVAQVNGGILLALCGHALTMALFHLDPARARQLCLGAILLAGCATALNAVRDPVRHPLPAEAINLVLIATTALTICGFTGRLARERHRAARRRVELGDATARLNELAVIDPLTGLCNRRHMTERLTQEHTRLQRHRSMLGVALIDLDHFKQVNDRHGHAVGDQVLQLFATELRAQIRPSDVAARWGGEEFLVLFEAATLLQCEAVLGALRDNLARQPVIDGDVSWRVQFSAGLTLMARGDSVDDTVARADAALYAAKHQGRGRTVSLLDPGVAAA